MFKLVLFFLILAAAPAQAQQVTQGQYRATPSVLSDGQIAPLQLTPYGSLYGKMYNDQSYSYAAQGITLAAAATDFFCISGSATKTIVIKRIDVSCTATALTTSDMLVVKRSTANTAGTSAAVTATTHDSLNAAATATVLSYTANPTVGTLVGNLDAFKITLSSTATQNNERLKLYGTEDLQAIRLHGVAESVCINFAAQTVGGASCNVSSDVMERN